MEADRPSRGEPLALDLVNTSWREDGEKRDLLASPAGARAWLAEHGLGHGGGPAERDALRAGRAAIRHTLEGERGGRRALNAVLAQGRITPQLGPNGPREHIEVAADHAAAWTAARDLLRLLATRPERLHRCANPDCVLWFEDSTRPGSRRWCSMAACGNRAKARRHAQRTRGAG